MKNIMCISCTLNDITLGMSPLPKKTKTNLCLTSEISFVQFCMTINNFQVLTSEILSNWRQNMFRTPRCINR